MWRWVGTSLLLCVLAAAGGCAHKRVSPNDKINQWLMTAQADLPPTPYRVQPPDKIEILSPNVKELDRQTAEVRPDGKIGLNLVGELYVAGMTPQEISQQLAKLLGKYYDRKALDVAVRVVEFKSQAYYVFGQVRQGGIKPYTGMDTVVRALADARLNEAAWPQKVVVIRPSDDPAVRQKVTIDLKQMYETGQTTQNYLLEEGDLIYVPRSPMAELNATFNKLLIPIGGVSNLVLLGTGF